MHIPYDDNRQYQNRPYYLSMESGAWRPHTVKGVRFVKGRTSNHPLFAHGQGISTTSLYNSLI